MPVVLMPALSPTMTEGKLARWLVKEGDEVRSGDVIAEIETDKAVMEVESLDDGKVSTIAVAEGTDGVQVGTAIVEILAEGEESAIGTAPAPAPATEGKPAEPPAREAAPAQAPADAPAGPSAPPEPAPATAPAAPPAPAPAPAPAATPAPPPAGGGNRVFASPLARRIAAEKGIDLASVRGSGPKGRIVRADVDAAGPGARPAPGATAAVPAVPGERSTLVENSSMRNVIAERLQQSWNDAPHFFLDIDILLDPLLEARKALNEAAPEGVKVSVNDMLIKAAAATLMKHPELNASWEGTHIRRHHHADIAVAVSITDGLITPIVRDSEAKGLYAISAEMAGLAARAREGGLKPEEYAGGSFTISNLGMFGITSFTAIINPPHSAIMAVGAGEQRPVVRDGEVVAATVMTATLACDHRVVDGAAGAVWLAAFRDLVENPVLALG